MRVRPTALLLLGSSALLAPSVIAMPGGGGGGGGSPPSVSAPQFDPAQEYRNGIAALEAKKFAQAKKAFRNVLEVAPKDANTHFLAGLADAGLNDLKSAMKHYERAVRFDNTMVLAHQELGVTYAKLGDRQKAEAELTKLKGMSDACKGSCADAAKLTAAVQAVESALGAPKAAMPDTRPPLLFASAEAGDHAYLDAVSLINEGRYEDAIASLQKARATFGAHPDVLTYLGFANRKLHRFALAESYYRAALAAAPGHRGATEYYGELMVERGDLPGAMRMLARLDASCTFGCVEADELRRWIAAGRSPEG